MKAKMRMMHTMLRVLDLERSIAFYTGPLGMTLLRKLDFPEGRFSLAFVGYGEEPSNTVIELTHNWDQAAPYELGTALATSRWRRRISMRPQTHCGAPGSPSRGSQVP